jgi:VIT1/CCC1 family predicted Fe2+/Mn2+ transporter
MFSVVVTPLALTVFGYIESHFAGTAPVRGALQKVLIGRLAAAVAFAIARVVA